MNDKETAEFRARIEKRLAALSPEGLRCQDGQQVGQLDQQSVGRLSRMDA